MPSGSTPTRSERLGTISEGMRKKILEIERRKRTAVDKVLAGRRSIEAQAPSFFNAKESIVSVRKSTLVPASERSKLPGEAVGRTSVGGVESRRKSKGERDEIKKWAAFLRNHVMAVSRQEARQQEL